ncbi:MAG: hypothetical protein SCH98_19465 [Deferrisomatales bacterium]|nr:hypothetical protein [Deferrisomatales bacterium]
MRKLIGSLGVLCCVLLLGGGQAFADDPTCYDLVAGNGSDVAGKVCVSVDGANLKVEYDLDGWCMTKSHLHVADDPGDIPQNRAGNPTVGKFAYGETYDPCTDGDAFAIPLADLGDGPFYIAAHAVVWDESSNATVTVASDTSTRVVEVNGVTGDADAALALKPLGYPNCESYSSDSTVTVWDTQIGSTNFASFQAAGARWIWNADHPDNPRDGDVVTFEETFDVPGLPFGASLLITADNAFVASLNDSFVGQSVSIGPGFDDSLQEQENGTPQAGDDWGVASQGWQKVESFPLGGIVSGENTLTVVAANEYMMSDDRQFGWNNTAKAYTGAITNDPTPGASPGEYPCYNPAGLIFKASIDYYARSETAWGAAEEGGMSFPGSNWATYFVYTVPE